MFRVKPPNSFVSIGPSTFTRHTCNYPKKYVPSKTARRNFLDFFIKDNCYNFIRSSPVVPFYDPTVPFVNAGMNQFKGIFLGTQEAKHKKVANSQKCIRIGGKHNDLNVVGTDGYHHTFFEMLGNWSFGECSKKESCGLAWKLLTEVYSINKNSLYVTYFGGDEKLGLAPDLECKEVWKELGIPEDRILPFGMKDNFWEMGATGPCGPCTEIHFDHLGGPNRARFVNKGLHELVELWNIVFIEYNRGIDGSISQLPSKHVDTGMGFERLVAILQGKVSNYNTDIFRNIFSGIQKICGDIPVYKNYFGEKDWDHLHTGYRIMADHARMVTVSLADGVIPEQNQKLRKIMRRAFAVSQNTFKRDNGLLKELSNYVIDSLGPTYPELENNAQQIHQIIDYEEEVYNHLRHTASKDWTKMTQNSPTLRNLDVLEMPGLVQAYKEITSSNLIEVSPEFGFKLFDTYGLDEENIQKLSKALNLKFDENAFRAEMEKAKARSKQNSISLNKLFDLKGLGSGTEDKYKYDYKKGVNGYEFNEVKAEILKILQGNEFVQSIEPNKECSLLLNKTNLYSESGGQINDSGSINFEIGDFEVHDLIKVQNYILHKGIFKSKLHLNTNSTGTVNFDREIRLSAMRNHTAVHLLNAFLKELKCATCQKSSKVSDKFLNLDIGIFGRKLTVEDIGRIEEKIEGVIRDKVQVKTLEIDSQTLLGMDKVTMVPGETYPETGIRLIEIGKEGNILSREPCCGTHVLNTEDLEDFCIIHFKSIGRSTASLYAVTGERAKLAKKNGQELLEHIAQLQKNVDDNIDKPDVLEMAVAGLKLHLNYEIEDDNIIPVTVKQECLDKLNSISKQIKEAARNSLKEFIDMEMQNVLLTKRLVSERKRDYIVHYLRTSMIMESVPLQRATKICQDLPVLVVSYSDNIVKARCCVPSGLKNENFDAEKWLKVFGDIFKSPVAPPKGQDASLVCNLKGKKVSIVEWHTLLNDGMQAAILYAKKHL